MSCYLQFPKSSSSKFGVHTNLFVKWPIEVILGSGEDGLIQTNSCRKPHGVPIDTSNDTAPNARLTNIIIINHTVLKVLSWTVEPLWYLKIKRGQPLKIVGLPQARVSSITVVVL